jgi:O-acetyl-ADP-ribose deacetylase (regulator of RNase III)
VRLARACGFTSVSFPAIGTGAYRFPLREAAVLAVQAVVDEIRAHGGPRRVRFVLPDQAALELYEAAGDDASPAIRFAA